MHCHSLLDSLIMGFPFLMSYVAKIGRKTHIRQAPLAAGTDPCSHPILKTFVACGGRRFFQLPAMNLTKGLWRMVQKELTTIASDDQTGQMLWAFMSILNKCLTVKSWLNSNPKALPCVEEWTSYLPSPWSWKLAPVHQKHMSRTTCNFDRHIFSQTPNVGTHDACVVGSAPPILSLGRWREAKALSSTWVLQCLFSQPWHHFCFFFCFRSSAGNLLAF